MTANSRESSGTPEGKYLIFELDSEEFGISVLQVREIMKFQGVTPVPQAPPYVQGIINLRGRIIPVLNLRIRFSMLPKEVSERTCIVVVRPLLQDGDQHVFGVIVDSVAEVLFLGAGEIEQGFDIGQSKEHSFVCGMAKSKGRVKLLLDMNRVLGDGAHRAA